MKATKNKDENIKNSESIVVDTSYMGLQDSDHEVVLENKSELGINDFLFSGTNFNKNHIFSFDIENESNNLNTNIFQFDFSENTASNLQQDFNN